MLNYTVNRRQYLETILYIETDKGSGTGFIIHPSGIAVTCAHVVGGCSEIYARIGTKEDAIEKAEIVSIDHKVDLAIIMLEGTHHYASTLGMDEGVYIGEEIIILGYPFGNKVADDVMSMSVSFTRGYVSSMQTKNGRQQALLDISAKAGNSGSPVIGVSSGNVIGVLSGSILGGHDNREEVNYMIPISSLNNLLAD